MDAMKELVPKDYFYGENRRNNGDSLQNNSFAPLNCPKP